ncbi:TonB-dependent receptor [Phenylobacterium sp. LjRoot219]|uniref:TonB-dependent receptor domain-containing protein n=1 Tax=Phenylobacterium sp. LjRoot219 TaxID=3342283 RepID=UPI003ECC2BF9
MQFGEVPKHTASAWAMKAFDIDEGSRLRFGAGVRYVGSVLSTTEGWQQRTPGYTLVDALAEWERDNWVLSLRASNLFDKRYFAACRVYGDCFTGNGRNVVGSLGYRF